MVEKNKEKVESNYDVSNEVDKLAKNGQAALLEYMELSQTKIDSIVKKMALSGHENQRELAKLAVEETGRGIFEDKVIKNIFATEYIYNNMKYQKSVGIVHENEEEGYMEIAEPVGVVCGVTPVTNPTSTTMFKALIAVKTRNPIIFAFHPSAQKCSVAAAKVVYEAALAAGAPKHCIQWIESPSVEATQYLMNHKDIALVLATGGSGMVKAAYSTGKPALGVGPGNVPCFIEKSANIKRAVTDLIVSKSFDNGMICASEQAAIIEKEIYSDVVNYMKNQSCYFTTKEETKAIEEVAFPANKGGTVLNAAIVGMSPVNIAKLANINIPANTKIICCEIAGVGVDYPLSQEKLSPILAVIKADNCEQGIKYAEKMVELGGLGHSSVIHSENEEIIREFSLRLKTGRILTNAPSTHGAIGDIYNTNIPSLTLGCGSYGRNSTTANVSEVNLINKKRVSMRRNNMQWFKIPNRVYFEAGSIQYLAKLPNVSRVFIVTDQTMEKIGILDKVTYHLQKNKANLIVSVFSDVEPDPSFETVKRGTEAMNTFKPDVIIALGGGSPIDAAKAMWLFYEQPDIDFKLLSHKFLDIRKRVYKIPSLGAKAKMVAIPTTSGTGSEVTSFAVITDAENNIKYPFADYGMTPDVAIVDPDLVMTVPKSVTADTGMDVLTHAIESYVSIMASDYTDGLALKAIELVFKYLPQAYKNGDDKLAREKMHNASTIAGMAFTNAFLGINHSLAHKIGGEFHTPHGRTNAILLPHVIRYNGEESPTKYVSFPKYKYYIAPEKYCEIAKFLGLPAKTCKEGVESLANAVANLSKQLDIPETLKDCDVNEKDYMNRIDVMAENAFNDQCTTANPRLPLVTELRELLRVSYYGK